jgi:hypothetical protein
LEFLRAIDAYCERMDAGFWAEPVNAVTNLAFIVAAIVMWRRTSGLVLARALCVVLAAIGLGSFLFHTFAQVWAAIADVAPIVLFILLYLFAINLHAIGMRLRFAVLATLLFFPYAALLVLVFSLIPGLGSSAGYAPVPLLIILYAAYFRGRDPELARGLLLGALILCLSLAFRTVDLPFCTALPLGTHFMWHLLNGLMLGWMIEVYRRSRLGKPSAAG